MTVGGVIGTYPSKGNPLAGADVTADLREQTFTDQLKSVGSLEFLGSHGTRYAATGNPHLISENLTGHRDFFWSFSLLER